MEPVEYFLFPDSRHFLDWSWSLLSSHYTEDSTLKGHYPDDLLTFKQPENPVSVKPARNLREEYYKSFPLDLFN